MDKGGPRAKFCRVRVRNPPRKKGKCRTPAWAGRVARSVKKGAQVRTCNYREGWDVQSVLVPKTKAGECPAKTVSTARKIQRKIKKRRN